MKVKIKSFNGELPDYLTEGKDYQVCGRSFNTFLIYSDMNERVFIVLDNCNHLKGGSWEVVE